MISVRSEVQVFPGPPFPYRALRKKRRLDRGNKSSPLPAECRAGCGAAFGSRVLLDMVKSVDRASPGPEWDPPRGEFRVSGPMDRSVVLTG